MDNTSISPSQRAALEQLQVLTNGGDPDVAIDVLESVDWDVTKAAELIFDNAPSTSNRGMESFSIDDSEQGPLIGGNDTGTPRPTSLITRRNILALITFPFNLLSNILRFLFGVLHIPFPRIFSTLNIFTPRRPSSTNKHFTNDPKSVDDRWVRSLEEETGAVCINRGESTGVAGPSNVASSSTLRPRGDLYGNGRILPDFYLGGYEEAMRVCQKELRIGCVILVSEEHEDVGEFKKTTLTDPQFVNFLKFNNFVVWGGDIRDKDAWSTAQKLQATTYPFIAFAALQPRRAPSTASSTAGSPVMTVLSRHAGLSATTTEKLLSHLNDQLFPRVRPFLDRLRNEERRREEERRMREEQDRAYREAMNRDKHRIEKKIREEEEKKRIAEEELLAAQLRIVAEKEAQEKQRKWEEQRMLWRRYMRKVVKEKEAHLASGDQVRIGVRLPDGRRIIRKFDSDDSVSLLYACVDSHFIPEDLDPATDPSSPPSSSVKGELALHALHDEIGLQEGDSHKWWGFMLVSSYPRKEVPWDKGVKIGDIDCLRGGGQLVVEMVAIGNGNHKVRKSLENARDSDEYDTESDEE